MITTLRAIVTLFLVTTSLAAAGNLGAQGMQWKRFTMAASGVSLRVPLGVFEAMPADTNAQGRLFIAGGGEAHLLLGAFENENGRSLTAHRRIVIEKSYPGADIDYAPQRRSWFVLSGTMVDGRTFYQRVAFSCSGRLISSWALVYQTSRKRFYDNIINRMHKSFEPGHGPDGDCRLRALTN